MVDGLLDHRGVERPVRKAVERDHFQAAGVELRPELAAQPGPVGQLGRHGCGQPQAEAEHVRAEALTHPDRVRVELRDDAREVLRRVHVGAVAEMDGLAVPVA
jgi:hypothetical protein